VLVIYRDGLPVIILSRDNLIATWAVSFFLRTLSYCTVAGTRDIGQCGGFILKMPLLLSVYDISYNYKLRIDILCLCVLYFFCKS